MNYEKLAETSQKLIEKNGRDVTIIKNSETLSDNNKPWRGSTPGMDNTNETAIDCKALFTGIESVVGKDNVQMQSQVALVAAKSAISGQPPTETDLTDFDRVSDGSRTWEVIKIIAVNPGPRALLWKLYLEL